MGWLFWWLVFVLAVGNVYLTGGAKKPDGRRHPVSAAIAAGIMVAIALPFLDLPIGDPQERRLRELQAEVDRLKAGGVADSRSYAAVSASSPVVQPAGELLYVASDPRARYSVTDVHRRSDGLMSISTIRSGPSGTSYSEAAIDCGAGLSGIVREGETLEEFEAAAPRRPMMGPLVSGSISDVKAARACAAIGG